LTPECQLQDISRLNSHSIHAGTLRLGRVSSQQLNEDGRQVVMPALQKKMLHSGPQWCRYTGHFIKK